MGFTNPTVSVLMPVYNGERYLVDAIESILNQTYEDFEFLIANDCSTDNSIEIIRSYHDKRIRLIQNEKNLGQVVTMNKGIELAKGKYIARLDQDDLAHKRRIKNQVTFLNSNQDIAVVGSHIKYIDKNNNYLGELRWPVGFESNLLYILTGNNPVGHTGVMYRKNVIVGIGYYRQEYKTSEDTDLWFRIYKSGYSCDNIPRILTYCRKHSKQSSLKFKELQHKNHNSAFYDFYTGLVKKEICYYKIEHYLNVMTWKSEKFKIKTIGNISFIIWDLFEKLIFLHRCSNGSKSPHYNIIFDSSSKLFIPFQLFELIKLLIRSDIKFVSLIMSLLKRINTNVSKVI